MLVFQCVCLLCVSVLCCRGCFFPLFPFPFLSPLSALLVHLSDRQGRKWERESGSRKIAFLRTTKSALYCCSLFSMYTSVATTSAKMLGRERKKERTRQSASHLRQHQQLMRLLFVCCCTVAIVQLPSLQLREWGARIILCSSICPLPCAIAGVTDCVLVSLFLLVPTSSSLPVYFLL